MYTHMDQSDGRARPKIRIRLPVPLSKGAAGFLDDVQYKRPRQMSEGGMIRLETFFELKFMHSSFSSLSSYCN